MAEEARGRRLPKARRELVREYERSRLSVPHFELRLQLDIAGKATLTPGTRQRSAAEREPPHVHVGLLLRGPTAVLTSKY